MDTETQTKLEAAVFRRLVAHLQHRTDAQNIDLMGLAGFCRNCLANWLEDAAKEEGVELARAQARMAVYGMPYDAFKDRYQTEATEEQLARMAESMKKNAGH